MADTRVDIMLGDVLLRLSDLERQKLQLVVAGLKVSEYTDDVDNIRQLHHREKRMVQSMIELFDTNIGLAIASDTVPRSIKDRLLTGDTSVTAVVPLLENLFEIVRRHKRLNPFANRCEFGKLMMLLQDVQRPSVRQQLGISSSLVTPIQTVRGTLSRLGCEELLSDPATRDWLKLSGKAKDAQLHQLVDTYAGEDDKVRREVVERCLRSMDDSLQFVHNNVEPLVWLQSVLMSEFAKLNGQHKYSLAIRRGCNGSCLTHDHATQCQYVRESLLLWEIVQHNIFNIWVAAEQDMLLEGGGMYSICDTGQGYHRMSPAPHSYKAIASCVQEAKNQMGGWVGISVIHLGDRDVPNPLVFIDKYTIIPRIVQPIMHTINALRDMFEEPPSSDSVTTKPNTSSVRPGCYPGLHKLFREKYHSYDELRMTILSDFFKHAFDGSGDDGGNCIDGRLTSAWNWCHKLEKKPYYDAFVLTGFSGFD